jgi:hypothetical protein
MDVKGKDFSTECIRTGVFEELSGAMSYGARGDVSPLDKAILRLI